MGAGDLLRDAYRCAEDWFYSLLDWLDAHGVPVYSVVDWLEDRGIPAFPAFLAVILVLLASTTVILGQSAVPTRSIMITVQDEYGRPVPGAQVVLHAPGGATLTATTDETGTAYFDDVPEGAYSYEVLVNGRKLGEKTDVDADMDTITLSPPEDESIRFCVQVLDDETGETVFGATVTSGRVFFEYVGGLYCARVRDGAVVSVGADGYEGKQITAQPGYDESRPYTVRLRRISSASSAGYVLTVTVVYGGEPAAARVRIMRGGAVLYEQAVPGTTGTASFSGLPPGEYTVIAIGEGEYASLRVEKTVDLDRNTSVTLDLREGEASEPPAETAMMGEEGYEYAYTINGSSARRLRVGRNVVKVCAKTLDGSVDAVEVSVSMDGKTIGGPVYIAPEVGEVSCEEVVVNAEREGTATLRVRFTAGGRVVKEYSEEIPVEIVRFSAVLCARGDDGKSIPGARIKVGAEEKTTDSAGCASFSLPPGEYDVHVEADGYLPLDDKLMVSSHTRKTFVLPRDLASAGYYCEEDACFRVLYNGLPSSELAEGLTAGKLVTIKACARNAKSTRVLVKNIVDGREKTLAAFSIPASPTTRCVSRSVRPSEGTLAVEFVQDGETVYADEVSVRAEMHTLTLCAYSSKDRSGIAGARVVVGGESGTTGEDGCADINLPAGRWKYRVEADGYLPASGTVSVYSPLTRRVYLAPKEEGMGRLRVCVRDAFSRKPVEGATVHVGDQEWTTGENGCVEGAVEPGTYGVWAEKEGYIETGEKSVAVRAGARRNVVLTMRPDVEGALVFVGITSGGQPVAVLAGGTYTLEFSAVTPSRARKATIHVAVDKYQDVLTVGGGKHATVPAPAPGRAKTVRITLRVKPVQERTTLPIYYYMSVETDEGERRIPSGGGRIVVDIYPLAQAVPCSRSGVGVTVFPRVDGRISSHLQAGVENELVVLAATCRPDVSVSEIVLTIRRPDGEKEVATFAGAGEPYRPKEHTYTVTPKVKDVGAYTGARVEAKHGPSVLAVSERKFRITHYQRDVCLRVRVDPPAPKAGAPLVLRIYPHLCQSESELPGDWSEHADDIKIQIVGGSAIPRSMYGRYIPFSTTIVPRSHGDIVIACTASYYTCRFDPPDNGTDKYTIWVYGGGLLRFSSDLYALPLVPGEVYNEIPLRVLNYTKYDVHDLRAAYVCSNYTPGLWQFEVSPPPSVPASGAGEPGEAEVVFSAMWAGEGEPKETPECAVILRGTYAVEEKMYAVMATTRVRVNAGASVEGIRVSPLGEDGKMHVQTGVWRRFEVEIELPENVPFSDPDLRILLEADGVSYDLDGPDTSGNVLKYSLWLKDGGTADREYPLTLIFSARAGVKSVREEVTYTVRAEYLPEIIHVEPANLSFTVWPDGSVEPGEAPITIVNRGAGQVTVSVSYGPEGAFYALSVEGERGAYFTLDAGERAHLNVRVRPAKEKLGATPLSGSAQITIEYSVPAPSGVERGVLEVPVAVKYIPRGCLELELLRDKVRRGEKTVLVIRNACGADVGNITVYETVDGSTCTYGGGISIPADVGEAYVRVPFFTGPCREPEHDTVISFHASAPHVGPSPRVALMYVAEEAPYREGTFYSCDGAPRPGRVAYAYDEPFNSGDSCDVAYCGYGEFYSALQEELARAFAGAASDAKKFSVPGQIPGCKPSSGWCELPVRSFTLYAKDGVQIIQLAGLLNERFAEMAGRYYQYMGVHEDALAPSGVYTTGDSDPIDGCGRYTFVVRPYVQVTQQAVVPDHLAFVLTIRKTETDECRDRSVLNAHLHFNFGSGSAEKGAVATVFFDTLSFFETAGVGHDLANSVEEFVRELEDMNAVRVHRDARKMRYLAPGRAIVLRADTCGSSGPPPLAEIRWDGNILSFTFCRESADKLAASTVRDIMRGWLTGPDTEVKFSGCLRDDQTFLVYGVAHERAKVSGTHGTVRLMPGIPAKIELDFHGLGMCPAGMVCYYRVEKVLIAYRTREEAESGETLLEDVATYRFRTPATATETAEGGHTGHLLTDGSIFEITLSPDREWGDRATIVLILTPANEYGEGVKKRRVVIPVEIAGLEWEELVRILLAPDCDYETWEACVFRKMAEAVAEKMRTSAGEAAKMITGKVSIAGIPLESVESWDTETMKMVSKSAISFSVWVRDPPIAGDQDALCNYIKTRNILLPEDSYQNYIVSVYIDGKECASNHGIAGFRHFAEVASLSSPSGARAVAAHAGACVATTVLCEIKAGVATLGTSFLARAKDIAVETIGCGVGALLSNIGLQQAAAAAIAAQRGDPWAYVGLAAGTALTGIGFGGLLGQVTKAKGALTVVGVPTTAGAGVYAPLEAQTGAVAAFGAYSSEGLATVTGGRIAAQAIARYLATERYYRRLNAYYKQLTDQKGYLEKIKGAPSLDDLRKMAELSEELSSTWRELRAVARKLGLEGGALGTAPPNFVDELAGALKDQEIFKDVGNARDFVTALLKGGEDDLLMFCAIARDPTANEILRGTLGDKLINQIAHATDSARIREILKSNNIDPEALLAEMPKMKRKILQSEKFKKAVKSAWESTTQQALEGLKKFKRSWLGRFTIQLGCGSLGQLAGTFSNLAVLSHAGAFDAPDVTVDLSRQGGYTRVELYKIVWERDLDIMKGAVRLELKKEEKKLAIARS